MAPPIDDALENRTKSDASASPPDAMVDEREVDSSTGRRIERSALIAAAIDTSHAAKNTANPSDDHPFEPSTKPTVASTKRSQAACARAASRLSLPCSGE